MDYLPPTLPIDAPQEVVAVYERPQSLNDECLAAVSNTYAIHPAWMALIQKVEGGYSGAKVNNQDGTWDLGLMQINSIHLPELRKHGLTELMVQNNDCINLAVSAWYLRKVVRNREIENHEEFFDEVARYNSKTSEHRIRYKTKLLEEYEKALSQQITGYGEGVAKVRVIR